MRKRCLLLLAELGGTGRIAQRRRPEAMSLRHGQDRRVLLETPLRGEHLAAAEALLTRRVASQPDQVGCRLDPRQHRGELCGILGVPVDEAGELAPGEGRLVLGQHRECDLGVGDDPGGIALDDLQLLGHPAVAALCLVVAAALDLEATRDVAAMVDPRLEPTRRQPLVDVHRQLLTPLLDQGRGIPVPYLGPEPLGPDRAQRQQHMGVDLGPGAVRHGLAAMHVEIGHHAAVDEQLLHDGPGELDVLRLRQLVRQRELDVTGQLGVLAPLCRLDRVPQTLPVGELVRCPRRQQDRRVQEVGLVLEVVAPVAPRVVQPGRGPIGGGRHDRLAARARDDLHAGLEDGHAALHRELAEGRSPTGNYGLRCHCWSREFHLRCTATYNRACSLNIKLLGRSAGSPMATQVPSRANPQRRNGLIISQKSASIAI